MVARRVLISGVVGLLLAGPAIAAPAMASIATPSGKTSDIPPPAVRIAATTAT